MESFVDTHPNLVLEWNDDKEATSFTRGSNYKAQWVCKEGHVWTAQITKRTKGSGCPYCSGRLPIVGVNDLATTHPELTKEWSPKNAIKPYEVSAGSNKKVYWICPEKHEYETRVANRTKKQSSSCHFCSGNKVLVGYNDLATLYPKLKDQWSILNEKSPFEVSPGSMYKAKWKCELNHEWISFVKDRTGKIQNGCPYCSGRLPIVGVNDLATTHPELTKEWSPKNTKSPREVSRGSIYKAQWVCIKGHEWEMSVGHRAVAHQACPICANKKVLEGYNDLATTHPHLTNQWATSNIKHPTQISYGSEYKAQWVCIKGHEWETYVRGRSTRGYGCPSCGEKVFSSKAEKDIKNHLSELGITTIKDRKILNGRELDIYIPSHNFAIEYNGVYWHSEKAGKNMWYHYDKWKLCKDNNIRLTQVWEDDYNRNPELVKRMLSHKLGISKEKRTFARKTHLSKKITSREAESFYNKYHIQGSKKGSHYGLIDKENNELVGLSTWKKDKSNKTMYLERYATSCILIGGFSKLLKYAATDFKEEGYEKIMTFSAHEVSDGALYENNGFIQDKELKPDYSYLYKSKRVHKFNFRIERFRKDPDLEYKGGFTEKQLAELNGIWRVWDAGKTRWRFDLTKGT